MLEWLVFNYYDNFHWRYQDSFNALLSMLLVSKYVSYNLRFFCTDFDNFAFRILCLYLSLTVEMRQISQTSFSDDFS